MGRDHRLQLRSQAAGLVAGAGNAAEALAYCRPDHAFGGGTVWLVQFPLGDYDGDYAC